MTREDFIRRRAEVVEEGDLGDLVLLLVDLIAEQRWSGLSEGKRVDA